MSLMHRLVSLAMIVGCFATNAMAATNPIGFRITSKIPSTVQLNQNYPLEIILINELPFTLRTPLIVTNNSVPASETVVINECSGKKLAKKSGCHVGIILTPKTVGQKSLSIYAQYGANKVRVPATPVITTAISGGSTQITGEVIEGLPLAVQTGVTYTLGFQFTNTGNNLNGMAVSPSPGNSPGFTQTYTNCGAVFPGAGTSCIVIGTFTTTASSGNVNVGVTYSNGSASGSATTSSVISAISGKGVRTFTFVNNCGSTVYFGFVGGAVNSNSCKTDADCSYGSFCDPAAASNTGQCFYGNPLPSTGSYALAGSGGTTAVTVNDYGLQYVWSGNLAARTGASCGTGTCDTADCGSGTGNAACPVGSGFAQPATLAEITMLRGSVDSYDVSVINGINVGIEMMPTTTGTFTPNGIAAYNCQSPGNPNAVPGLGLGACDWASGFTPPAFPTGTSASSYVYVKPPGSSPTACTDDTPCTTPPYSKCGLNFNTTTQTLSKVCGQFLGYVSADQVCSFAHTNLHSPNSNNNPGNAYFNCDSSLGGSLSQYTNWGMFACKGQANGDLNTCYNTSANKPVSTTNCCGCVNWQNEGGGIVVPSTTTTCVKFDSIWTSLVKDGVKWLKKGCPTAYSYPYDDKASGFSCMDINGGNPVNTVNYTITFCPT